MAYNLMESRRRILWESGRVRLPNTYQEVRYIDNLGEAHINTGIYPEDNVDVDLLVKYMPIVVGSNYILTSRNGSNGTSTGFVGSQSTGGINFRWGVDTTSYANSSITRVSGHVYTQHGIVSGGVGTLYVTDETTGNADVMTFPVSSLPSDLVTFKLCAANMSGGSSQYQICKRVRVYAAHIIKNGEYVMNFVPCYRKSDGLAGMYDLARQAFYPSTRSSYPFEAGPSV